MVIEILFVYSQLKIIVIEDLNMDLPETKRKNFN